MCSAIWRRRWALPTTVSSKALMKLSTRRSPNLRTSSIPNGWERWLEGMTRERLEKEGHVRLNLGDGPFLPFAKGGFATPSGKAELYSESLAAQGMDPVVSFVPAEESRLSDRQRNFRWSCWRAKPITFSTAHLPISRPCRRWSSRSCWRSAPLTPSAGISMKAIGCGSSMVAGKSGCGACKRRCTAGSGGSAAERCALHSRRQQHQRADLRNAYRYRRWSDVLFLPGGG